MVSQINLVPIAIFGCYLHSWVNGSWAEVNCGYLPSCIYASRQRRTCVLWTLVPTNCCFYMLISLLMVTQMYRVNTKSSSLQLLLIFHQWLQIFTWNFTWLSDNQIYTLLPSLVETYRKMTKLGCFSQDNPLFSVCEHHAELTECKRTTGLLRRLSGPQAVQIWSHPGRHARKVP